MTRPPRQYRPTRRPRRPCRPRRRRRTRGIHALAARVGAFVLVVSNFLVTASPARAEEPSREQQIKAAFLYNFLQFVDWPADAPGPGGAPYVVGVLGADDPLQGAMDRAAAGKYVATHPVVVKHFASADEVGPCHVLYVAEAGARDVARAAERLHGSATLLVGDAGAVDAGAAVGFFTEDNRIRLEVSLRAVERAKLHIRSRLLQLCKVRDG